MLRTRLSVATFSLLLLSCAGLMKQWRAENCNYKGAYETGQKEARFGTPQKQNFAGSCPEADRAEADRGHGGGLGLGQRGRNVEEARVGDAAPRHDAGRLAPAAVLDATAHLGGAWRHDHAAGVSVNAAGVVRGQRLVLVLPQRQLHPVQGLRRALRVRPPGRVHDGLSERQVHGRVHREESARDDGALHPDARAERDV